MTKKSDYRNPALSGLRRRVAGVLFALAVVAAAVALIGLLADLLGTAAAAPVFFFGSALSFVCAAVGAAVLPPIEQAALGYQSRLLPVFRSARQPPPLAPAARPLPPAFRPPRFSLA